MDTINSTIKTNMHHTLFECINQKKFDLLRLLCIIYYSQYKDDLTFLKISNLIQNNEIKKLEDLANSKNIIKLHIQ